MDHAKRREVELSFWLSFESDPRPIAAPRPSALEDLLADVDELLLSLGAGPMVREVVALRLQDYSELKIACELRMDRWQIQRYISTARLILKQVLFPHTGTSNKRRGPDGSRSLQTPCPPLYSRHPLYSRRPVPWRLDTRFHNCRHHTVQVCLCCEARLRPLTPQQSFGWRDIYYSEVHRLSTRR